MYVGVSSRCKGDSNSQQIVCLPPTHTVFLCLPSSLPHHMPPLDPPPLIRTSPLATPPTHTVSPLALSPLIWSSPLAPPPSSPLASPPLIRSSPWPPSHSYGLPLGPLLCPKTLGPLLCPVLLSRGDYNLRNSYGLRMGECMSELGVDLSRVRKVVDLGCASGLSSFALLEHLPTEVCHTHHAAPHTPTS